MLQNRAASVTKSIFSPFNLRILPRYKLEKIRSKARAAEADAETYFALAQNLALKDNTRSDLRDRYDAIKAKSKSQLRQDLFVLSELNFKFGGFFVEFGATDGVQLSNTFLLEKEFQWQGILAEPAKIWHPALKQNRSCQIDTRCVWSISGEKLVFNEVRLAELSTVASLDPGDMHTNARKKSKKYQVDTVSLNDLLVQLNAPSSPDYLSIDTEGSEFEILSNLNFDRFRFSVITCEHNYSPMREKIFTLLTRNGYERKFEEISKFDDWYVLRR